MKNQIYTFTLLLVSTFSTSAQYITIPDANLRATLRSKYATCFNSTGLMDTTCTAIVNETILDVSGLNVKNLKGLEYFKNLTELKCGNNLMENLERLPSTLKKLDCSSSQLLNLPELPSGLTLLNCTQNQLTYLPQLPASLELMFVAQNNLLEIPTLPANLKTLFAYHNQLQTMPALPSGLLELRYSYNQLLEVPTLPNSLTYLELSSNYLQTLPTLPSSLKTLYASSNCYEIIPINPNPQNLSQFYVVPNRLDCDVVTSAHDILAEEATSIYPNPTQGKVTIHTSGEEMLRLFDAKGQLILQEHILGTKELSLPALGQGIFHYQLGMQKGTLMIE